jgi:Spy/CpxP family protein refolding chaperone
MKRVMIALTVLLVFTVSAFAQRTAGQGGDMMGGGWGWGMNSGWLFVAIIALLVIMGIVYIMMKRR